MYSLSTIHVNEGFQDDTTPTFHILIATAGRPSLKNQLDSLKDEIDGLASYQNTITGYPDPTHTAVYGINPLNPNLFGLVERAEVNISLLPW